MPLSKMTAIVIDDDRDTVSVLSDFLQIKGIRVVGKGYDGQDAVELCDRLSPNVIFLDIMMSNYDGFYALEKIRKIQHDAYVIAVTADLRQDTYQRLVNLKISEIIYKPYDINDIMYKLAKTYAMRIQS